MGHDQNPHYHKKKMRLKEDCLFFQFERKNGKTKGHLLRLKPTPERWHTDSESALMLLDLLMRGGEKENEKGISYGDLKKHLVRRYQLVDTDDYADKKNVNKILKEFLDDLRTKEVLQDAVVQESVDDPIYQVPGNPEEVIPVIQGASSLFCIGYVVCRYRP
jgi:hypothetical protein